MSLIVSVLLIWSGIISYFLFYLGVLAPRRYFKAFTSLSRFLDGSITTSLLIVITCLAWYLRSNRYGHLAFGILFLITSFWLYFILTTLNYPTISLKLKEEELFPQELLDLHIQKQITEEKEILTNDKTLNSLIFVLPTLSNMFILHAVRRGLELLKEESASFTWKVVLIEEPSETPLLTDLQEYAQVSIVQDEDLTEFLIEKEKDMVSRTNKPLFFIMSPDKKIQWIFNPKSMLDLLLFDNNMERSIKDLLWQNYSND